MSVQPLQPKSRDYVLATKYEDGDPGDPWAVGFYARPMADGRHMVVGDKGASIYASGYRRVGRIPAAIGGWLMANASLLEHAPGKINLWGMYDWSFVNDELDKP